MNTLCREHSLVLATLVAFVAGLGNVCFSEDQEPVRRLDKEVSQLEQLWEAKRTEEYYSSAARIAKAIVKPSTTEDRNDVAVRLLDSLLAKSTNLPRTGVDDLFAMRRAASYLVSNATASIEDRRVNIQLLCRFLGEIRRETVPHFEPKQVTQNVSPPPGVTGMAGMKPEAISDPIARATYEAAIRQNRENNLLNSRQVILRSIDMGASRAIIAYMVDTFRAPDTSPTMVDECIKTARLTAEETKRVEDAIGSMDRKDSK